MSPTVVLRCPRCEAVQRVTRDEHDPARAAVVEIICLDCDDGDFHSPRFFDRKGIEIGGDS
jgi:hypothetical protein